MRYGQKLLYILKLWLVLLVAGGVIVRPPTIIYNNGSHVSIENLKKVRSVRLLFISHPFSDITRPENEVVLSSASNGAHFYAIEYCVQ
jgi:hypothetical protein